MVGADKNSKVNSDVATTNPVSNSKGGDAPTKSSRKRAKTAERAKQQAMDAMVASNPSGSSSNSTSVTSSSASNSSGANSSNLSVNSTSNGKVSSNSSSAENKSDFKSPELSEVNYVTDRESFPVDSETSRVHAPMTNEVIKIFPSGCEGSILSRAFSSSMEHIVDSPIWYGGRLSMRVPFNVTILKSYFDLIGDYVAVYYLTLNLIQLFEDYSTNKRYEKDKVMQVLLSNYFSKFVPSRKAFITQVETLRSHLEKFHLPGPLVDKISTMMKYTSIPYHGYEILNTKSILVSVPSDLFSRSTDPTKNVISSVNNIIINYPFDSKICKDPQKTSFNLLQIIEHINAKLMVMEKNGGEFNNFNVNLNALTPDWRIKLEMGGRDGSYNYIKPMSDSERISLINLKSMPTFRPYTRVLDYIHYDDDKRIDEETKDMYVKTSHLSNVIFGPDKFSAPITGFSSAVHIEDNLSPNKCSWTMIRSYEDYSLYHDSNGAFKLSAEEMLSFSIPFRTIVLHSNTKVYTPEVVIEPGLVSPVFNPDGFNSFYCFLNAIVADMNSVVNISPIVNDVSIRDYASAIGRRTIPYYQIINMENLKLEELRNYPETFNIDTEVNATVAYLSHPTIRKASLNMNVLQHEVLSIFKNIWGNDTLKSLYNARSAFDTRTDYLRYEVTVVNDKSDRLPKSN